MKIAKTFLFGLLSFIFLVSFASASFSFSNANGATQTISAGNTATISFDIVPSGHSGTLFNATLVLPQIFGSSTAWSGNTAFTVTNSTNVSRTISISVPANQASGTYNGQISLIGDYVTSTGNPGTIPSVTNLSITITVTAPPSTSFTLTASQTPVGVGKNATLTLSNAGSATSATFTETTSPSLGAIFTPNPVTLSSGSGSTMAVVNNGNSLKFGLNTVNVQATTGSQTATTSYQVKKTFCTSGETGTNVSISDIDWSNDGEGDDNEWELLDDISLDVEVSNFNQDDDMDIVVELGLFDSSGKNVADDLVFLDDSDSDDEKIDININDDDEETVTFNFKVPADFDAGDYKLTVKAYEDGRETRNCDDTASGFDQSFFQEISVKEASDEGRYVIVDDIETTQQVTCGETVQGSFVVFNVGEDDQDRVRILAKSTTLDFEKTFEITNDLDKGEDQSFDFSFIVPNNAENKRHVIQFSTEYDYKNGVYRQESDDTFDASIEVIGCLTPLGGSGSGNGGAMRPTVVISADLDSKAIPGQELVIIATVRNLGSSTQDFSIAPKNFGDWATLVDVSDSSFSLEEDESKEITLTFNVKDDAVGAQTMDIEVVSDSKVTTQEVEVNLEKKAGLKFSLGGNNWVWVVGIVNVILIVLIIIVAVRLSKR